MGHLTVQTQLPRPELQLGKGGQLTQRFTVCHLLKKMSGICIGALHDCFLNPAPAHCCWNSDVYFPSLQRLSPHLQTVLTIHTQHSTDLVFSPVSQWKHIILLFFCIVMTCFNLRVPQVSAADLFGPRSGSEPVHRPGLLHTEGRCQTPAAVPHLRWSPAH